jgi:N-acetylglutamate synthase
MRVEQDILKIEMAAANTWPAKVSERLGSWVMRASGGITKRANSVLALGEFPEHDYWLKTVEAFYTMHDLPARFHVSDASPTGLDAILAEQGYVLDTPCIVMIAATSEVISRTNKLIEELPSMTYTYKDQADSTWLNHFMQIEGWPEERRMFYRDLVTRMPQRKAFLELSSEHNAVVGIGTAIVEDGLAGLTNVAIAEANRGQGCGKHLIKALVDWSMQNGADRLYLQVIRDNEPAVRLYERCGFRKHYAYHYRTKE